MSVIPRKKWCVRTRCAAIVNHPAVLEILRVVNLLRVVFLVRRGPLGLFLVAQHCDPPYRAVGYSYTYRIYVFSGYRRVSRYTRSKRGIAQLCQQVLNPTPLNPTPATCHKRKQKLRCNFRNAALQKLHCNIRFSAVRKSFVPKAALQQAKNCTATSKKLRCRKAAFSCRFPAGFKPPRLGTHV